MASDLMFCLCEAVLAPWAMHYNWIVLACRAGHCSGLGLAGGGGTFVLEFMNGICKNSMYRLSLRWIVIIFLEY